VEGKEDCVQKVGEEPRSLLRGRLTDVFVLQVRELVFYCVGGYDG